MRWLKLNPAGRVNITDQDAFNQVTDVAKYANGRLVPNDRTRVHRDWKFVDVSWDGENPSTYSSFTRFEGLFSLDIDNGPEGETPSQLGYVGALIRLDEGGANDQTVFNVLRPNGDGTWAMGAKGEEIGINWWDDEGQVVKLTGPNSWDHAKAGAWVLVGSIGDPFAIIPDAAGVDVFRHHLLARMRPPKDDSLKLEDELYIPTQINGGPAYHDGTYAGFANKPAGSVAQFVYDAAYTPAEEHFFYATWHVVAFYYSEITQLDGEWYESEHKRIGWTVGLLDSSLMFAQENNLNDVWAAAGYSDPIYDNFWSGQISFPGSGGMVREMWPTPTAKQYEHKVDDRGFTDFRWKYKLFQDAAAPGPQAYGVDSPTTKYRIYAQSLGIANTKGFSYDVATYYALDWPVYYWTKPGSYYGTWSLGQYTPATWTYLPDPSIQNICMGYDPANPIIRLAESWDENKAPLLGNSFAEVTAYTTPGVTQEHWYDPFYDYTLLDTFESFDTPKIEFGDGKGVIRYDAKKTPSRYVIVEQFRGHTLSVPIDNTSVIEFSPPDEPYYRPDPFRLFIQTEGNDEILAIKAYQNMALIFTRSHVLKLNYLPLEGVFQDKEMIEVLCRGRVLTERKAITTVSFNNSHFIAWMSRDGISISDGNIVYNACPDFSLEALNFTLTTDADGRMSLINNIDDYRLELWLHSESDAERWDFYYHDSHLVQQRFFKLRGPTVISSGCKGVTYINDLPGDSRRTGRVMLIKGNGDLAIQSDLYTDDTLKWWADRVWGADPLDLVRFDGMMLEVPGHSGHDYYTYNYSSSTEATEARKERNAMDLFAGPKLTKASLEDSSGEWVQPGFEVEHNVVGDTWVGAVWLKINSKDRAN